MDLDKVILNRHTVREFKAESIPYQIIKSILEAAFLAPSAGNLQAYRVFVVTNPEKKKMIAASANDQDFIANASVCLVFAADPERSSSEYGIRGRSLYCIQDATIAATFALLKAVDLGYATAWIGSFDTEMLAGILEAKPLVPVSIILVGVGSERPESTSRRDLRDIVKLIP